MNFTFTQSMSCPPLTLPGWKPSTVEGTTERTIVVATAMRPRGPSNPASSGATTRASNNFAVALQGLHDVPNARVIGECDRRHDRAHGVLLLHAPRIEAEVSLRCRSDGRGRTAFGFGPYDGRRVGDLVRAVAAGDTRWMREQAMRDCLRLFGRPLSVAPAHTPTESKAI